MTPHVRSRARELARAATLLEAAERLALHAASGQAAIAREPRADVGHLEDVIFTERLARLARPTLVPAEVVTGSRKFVKMGVLRSPGRCLAILLCYELRLPMPTRAFFAPIR